MYSSNRSKTRTTVSPKEVNLFGLQFSVQPASALISEKPGGSKQANHKAGKELFRKRNDSFLTNRGLHDNQISSSKNVFPNRNGYDVYSTRRGSEHLHGDIYDTKSSSPYASTSSSHEGTHRQVHRPSPAFATQLSDLTSMSEVNPFHANNVREESVYPLQPHTRKIHSAGVTTTKQHRQSIVAPGDRVMFAESASLPGIPIVYRSHEEKSVNPDRLNLDRRRLAVCPILEGEDNLRLLNLQHNTISKIEYLSNLRRLIFLDLYDNQIEEIKGLTTLKSLRVLMLGKNRIRKIENLDTLTKLDVLDLHGNQISTIENLGHLAELRVLNLAGNEIRHVENLEGMDSLTELNLRRNRIVNASDVENLPKLQRLFLSFNNISSFEDIACLSDAPSLTEISLDGNPICHDGNYRHTLLKAIHQITQLDMKKISDEEKKIAAMQLKKEELKKKEVTKLAALKEKRRIAINNAARQWEATKSTAIAKAVRLQPSSDWPAVENGVCGPEQDESRPGSGEPLSSRGSDVDILDFKSRDTSRSSTRAESRKAKPPTPDLLANIPTNACHLAELEGTTLNLYGPGSLEALDKNWGVQAAGSINALSFKFIDFEYIADNLHKVKLRFPNVTTISLGECNLRSLRQLNAFSALRRLDHLTITSTGNPVVNFTLWKPYLLFRLSHLSIKTINDTEVTSNDKHMAHKSFSALASVTATDLPPTRVLALLGESVRKFSQGLSEVELKAKKQLSSEDGTVSPDLAGKAGLMYFTEDALKALQKERLSRTNFSMNYVSYLTTQAIKIEERKATINDLWPQIFADIVEKAVTEMWDVDKYRDKMAAKYQLKW